MTPNSELENADTQSLASFLNSGMVGMYNISYQNKTKSLWYKLVEHSCLILWL